MRHFSPRPLLIAVMVLVAGCASTSGDFYDPFEPVNRSIHEVNKGLDRALLRPTSVAYGQILPQEVRTGLYNASENLTLPGMVVNDLLQLQLQDAVNNTIRFALNSTVGLLGFFDPATELDLAVRPSDFGETLHVWGFPEGPYVELPLLGPSNSRDTVGLVADILINPVSGWLPANQQWVLLGAEAITLMDDRYTYGATLESVLYESADSYAQARLFYTENRRFELGGSQQAEDDLYDIYGEAFE